MKAKELRDLQDHELRQQIKELRREVQRLRFANATGELENTAQLRLRRKDLARALTVLRERELAKRNG